MTWDRTALAILGAIILGAFIIGAVWGTGWAETIYLLGALTVMAVYLRARVRRREP
jgi:uncharacterized membrane protein YobD (UPF0266 family)